MPTFRMDATDSIMGWSEIDGQGAPLLCLPGIGIPAAPYLARLFTEPPLARRAGLLVDLPGTGQSAPLPRGHDITAQAGAVSAVLDHLGLSALPVFGHSLGGSVAIALARMRPDLVARLIVAEGNLIPGGGAASRALSRGTRQDFVSEGFAAMMKARREAAAKGDATAAFLWSGRIDVDAGALFDAAEALVRLDPPLNDVLASLDIPRTFVFGARTVPASPGEATPDTPDPDWLRGHGIAVEVVPDAGHLMPFDNPAGTASAIARHL